MYMYCQYMYIPYFSFHRKCVLKSLIQWGCGASDGLQPSDPQAHKDGRTGGREMCSQARMHASAEGVHTL